MILYASQVSSSRTLKKVYTPEYIEKEYPKTELVQLEEGVGKCLQSITTNTRQQKYS